MRAAHNAVQTNIFIPVLTFLRLSEQRMPNAAVLRALYRCPDPVFTN